MKRRAGPSLPFFISCFFVDFQILFKSTKHSFFRVKIEDFYPKKPLNVFLIILIILIILRALW